MRSLFFAATVLASALSLGSAHGGESNPPSSTPSCGVKGYDKVPAYNFLNDTVSATFDKCIVRCAADSACGSFAFGSGQCLLYTQNVASNIVENSNSPFSFYDKACHEEYYPTSSATPSTSSESHPTSSETYPTSSETYTTSSETYTTSSEAHPTSPETHTTSSESHPTSSAEHPTSSETYPTSSEEHPTSSETHPTSSEAHPTSSDSYPTGTDVEPTGTETHPPSPTETEDYPETLTSYVDVTVTSCEPEYTECPTNEHPTVTEEPSHETTADVEDTYTTVITTHYTAICPTGYTTVPYTVTVTSSGTAEVHPTGLPPGFTTTVAVCPQCNSASPTVTLTVPVVSVVPVATGAESHPPPAATANGAYPPPAPPAPPASSAPGHYESPAPVPAAPATSGSPGASVDSHPTYTSKPYHAGNGTATYHPTGNGVSGSESTRPPAFEGAANRATEGTIVSLIVGTFLTAVMVFA